MNGLIRWQRPAMGIWPGFGRLSNLREELDRLFDAPLAELARTSSLLSGWSPPVDLYEDKDHVFVTAELPGMKKEDIEVSFHNGTLSVSGERKSEKTHEDAEVYRSERYFGRFQRTLALPTPVAADKVKAEYKDGILTITLPKTEEAKPRQIDVHVN